ncbi:hypothetical protein [Planococcus koreensis]|uniref:hypothetical protein n=1 Tax=Planococcus koreensis TaxID=112331 RepID=UPI0039FBFE3B
MATITYIYLKYIPLGTTLNDLSIKYTSKNFFSGRDPIWTEAINTVMQNGKFWTGLGNNVQYGSFDGYLHNLYVQVFYQSGFIGLLLIGFLLVSISYTISKAPKIDFEFKVLLAYFIAILFLQIFEGHLIYKLEIISVLSWIIIALLINKSSHADLFKTQSGNVNSPLTTFKKPARSDFT